MKILLFDLHNRNSLEKLSQQLRLQYDIVHEVFANLEELPNGAYGSVDQIWYQGTVLTKLADMFSAKLFKDGTEFIFDTNLTILNISVKMLTSDTDLEYKITDFRTLL